ncbi:hypothetical protein [Sphingobium sp. B2]|uniref:hypothetical protein n=1 Tax=Sphingobium sp. B2 TaxID=2583228 RepID=UPI0011A432C8|nr:hypothetical protein [Sphingobium sp. B2]
MRSKSTSKRFLPIKIGRGVAIGSRRPLWDGPPLFPGIRYDAVSYTQLDVYKRQAWHQCPTPEMCIRDRHGINAQLQRCV